MDQMVLLGDDRWTQSGIGAGTGWEGEKMGAGHIGKKLGMVSEAKGNAEKWEVFLSVAAWSRDSTWMVFLAKGVRAGHNNL